MGSRLRMPLSLFALVALAASVSLVFYPLLRGRPSVAASHRAARNAS